MSLLHPLVSARRYAEAVKTAVGAAEAAANEAAAIEAAVRAYNIAIELVEQRFSPPTYWNMSPILSPPEPLEVERRLHGTRPVEDSAVNQTTQTSQRHDAAGPDSNAGRDVGFVVLAMVPGAMLTGAGWIVNSAFVTGGWPLFAIMWLGLFAGTIAAVGGPRPSKT